jgi:hypothetical protein
MGPPARRNSKHEEVRMVNRKIITLAGAAMFAASYGLAQPRKPLSPAGHAATQVGGQWKADKKGEMRYTDGKWIEVDYSRPIKRGRQDLFGSGADYGKKVDAGAPVWRAGANQTTRLTTEVPLEIAGKTIPPGSYDVFVDLKEGTWTLILSTQPYQEKYDPKDKAAVWGSYGYDPKFDAVRAPMAVTHLKHSVDQFTIAFLDMTETGGVLAMAWDTTAAMVNFQVGH